MKEEFGKRDRISLEKRGRVWEKELLQQEEKKEGGLEVLGDVPKTPPWLGKLPGDRGGFLWCRWCVRT